MAKRTRVKPVTPKPPAPIPVMPPGQPQLPNEVPPMPQQKKKPWYKSKTILGILTTAAGWGLAQVGVDPAIIADGVSLNDVLTIAGAIIAMYGRAKAEGPLEG